MKGSLMITLASNGLATCVHPPGDLGLDFRSDNFFVALMGLNT